jgi:hypothetical protein
VNISGLIDLAQIPGNYHVFLGYRTADGHQLEATPLHVNFDQGTIWAQVNHFSNWGAGVAPGTPGVWDFAYNPPQVALFSGAATDEQALDIPAGRHGLKPDLKLTYSSARLNGRTEANQVERGPIGDSWSLDQMSIDRQDWKSCYWNDNGSGQVYGSCQRDVFTLIMNGTGYDLDAAPGPLNGRYYADSAPGLDISSDTMAA